jgi:hypothetical protein
MRAAPTPRQPPTSERRTARQARLQGPQRNPQMCKICSLIVWVFCGFCVEHPVGLTMLSGELPGHYAGTFPGSKVFWLSDGFIVGPQSPTNGTAGWWL